MRPEHPPTTHPPPATPGERPAADPYQPPAIAWEEPFETMAATSCAGNNPFDMNCQARPVA